MSGAFCVAECGEESVRERDGEWVQIHLLLHRPHVLIEVIGANIIHVGVGVGEEEVDLLTVFLLHHFIMERNDTYEMGL